MKGVHIVEELNMTVVPVLWMTQIRYFILSFPSQIFLVEFLCQLLPSSWFLKNSENCNVTNFCIISNLFHHKYNDKIFRTGNKKQVPLRNQLPCETSFPAKPKPIVDAEAL